MATYVTLASKRQFAAIQPSTITRVDLRLMLAGVKAMGRFQETNRVGGGRIVHCISLNKVGEFNAGVNK